MHDAVRHHDVERAIGIRHPFGIDSFYRNAVSQLGMSHVVLSQLEHFVGQINGGHLDNDATRAKLNGNERRPRPHVEHIQRVRLEVEPTGQWRRTPQQQQIVNERSVDGAVVHAVVVTRLFGCVHDFRFQTTWQQSVPLFKGSLCKSRKENVSKVSQYGSAAQLQERRRVAPATRIPSVGRLPVTRFPAISNALGISIAEPLSFVATPLPSEIPVFPLRKTGEVVRFMTIRRVKVRAARCVLRFHGHWECLERVRIEGACQMLNFWKSWQPSQNSSRRGRQVVRSVQGPASVEQFESRRLLTVTSVVSVSPQDVVVTISGTKADTLVIGTDAAGKVTVNGAIVGTPIAANVVTKLNVVGGTGNNRIDLSAVTATAFPALKSGEIHVNGGAGNDRITGSSLSEDLQGGDGQDSIFANGGNDTCLGGNGNDSIVGGDGTDSLDGGRGNDSLVGGDGNDLITGHGDNDFINGQAGNDTLLGGDGNDYILGGAGNDLCAGEADDGSGDTVNGQGGSDTVLGSDGSGADPNDSVIASAVDTINELFDLSDLNDDLNNFFT